MQAAIDAGRQRNQRDRRKFLELAEQCAVLAAQFHLLVREHLASIAVIAHNKDVAWRQLDGSLQSHGRAGILIIIGETDA